MNDDDNPIGLAILNPIGLERLQLFSSVESELESTFAVLRAAGLAVDWSKFMPGWVVGGSSLDHDGDIPFFQGDTFTIRPQGEGFLAALAGPGNLQRQVWRETAQSCAQWIVATTCGVRERP